MFTVLAGKYDGYDRNTKYVEVFATLDEAIIALQSVSDYPWSEIEYEGTDRTTWVMNVYPKPEHLR